MMSCVSPCTSSTNPSSCDSQPTIGGCDTVPGTSSFLAKTTINGGSVGGANMHMHQQVPSVEGMSSSSASPAVARSVPPSEPHYPESAAKVVYLTTEMANRAAVDYELEKFENIFEWLKTYKDSSNKENAPMAASSPAEQKPLLQAMLIPEKKAVKRMREDNEQEENDNVPKKPALDNESEYQLHEMMSSFKKEEIAPALPPIDENPLKRMERLTSSSNFSQPSTLSEVMEVPKKDDRCSKQDKEREQMNTQMMEQQQRMLQHQHNQHQMAMMAAHHQAAKASPNPNQQQFAMQMGPYGPIPPGAMPPHPGGHYSPQFMMNQHAARMMAAGKMGKGSPGSFSMMSPHHPMHPMNGIPAFRPGMPPMQPGMPSPQQQQQMMAHYMHMHHMRGIPPHAMNGMPPFNPAHPMFGAAGMPGGPIGPMGMPGHPGFPGHYPNIPRAPSAAMASPSLAPRPPSSSMGPGAPNSVPNNQSMISPYHGMVQPGGLPYPHQMRPGPSAPSSVAPGDPMQHSGMPGTGTPITGPTYPQAMPVQMHTPSSAPGFAHSGGPGPQGHMLSMPQHPGMLQAAPAMHTSQPRPDEAFPQYQWPQHFADSNAL